MHKIMLYQCVLFILPTSARAPVAGVNLMGIINSNTAAALQFGIEKDFADKTQHVIFFDLGSGSTIASLVKYSSYEAKEAGKPKAISQLEVC